MRLVAVAASFAVLGSAAAGAATITGTDRADHLRGTARADVLFGRGGADLLEGLGGDDLLGGGPGRDTLVGGAGNDRVAATDGTRDTVSCGPGHDLAVVDLRDKVAADCESVSRQLSRDGFSNFDAQHETEVEPAAAASGDKIVAAFQAGRFAGGGSAGTGFARSSNGGRSWQTGFLPDLTVYSSPAGRATLASDPSVAYDAVHRVWLISSLVETPEGFGVAVSRSSDGLSWSHPVQAAISAAGDLDKEWLTCDSWKASPFRGHCYLSYLDVAANQIVTRTSADGGLTWSEQVAPPVDPPPTAVNGAQPVVRPDGNLVVLYTSLYGPSVLEDEVLAVRSTDGGASFSAPTRVAQVLLEDVYALRSPALPAAGVDAAGHLYVVWQDCRFSEQCETVDLVLATSTDGVTWSQPVRIPTTVRGAGLHSLVPGFAVDATTAGRSARLGLVYDTVSEDCDSHPPCAGVDAYFISSDNGGTAWSRPERLSAESMRLGWIADGGIGRMVGDYQAVAFAGDSAVPVFSLASEPAADGTFRQAIFAGVPPARPRR